MTPDDRRAARPPIPSLVFLLTLALAAITGCDSTGGTPCPPGAEGCQPAVADGLRLRHGGLVQGGGVAVDDAHTADAVLLLGRVESRAGPLRLAGSLSN